MQSLSEEQWEELRKFNRLVKTADYELSDTFETGRMSDSKSAVFDMREAANALDLPDAIASELRQMAQESWQGALSSGGDVYARAGKAIAAVGKIERFLGELCTATGRSL